MKTHIPIPGEGRTYCGRTSYMVECINLRTTPIDDATCTVCQRSDDRRVRESYQREQAALPPEKRDGYDG